MISSVAYTCKEGLKSCECEMVKDEDIIGYYNRMFSFILRFFF